MRARDVALAATVLAAAGPAVTVAGAASAPRFGLEDQLRVGRDPLRLVAADFDQDGNPDLATANYHGGSVSVLIGHGDGSFAPQVVHRVAKEPAAIEAGDVDEDGRPDLIVASLNDPGSLTVLLHRDGGRF